MSTKVKICGINSPDAMTAALEGGADFVGLVFHPASPRHLDLAVAAYLSSYVPQHVTTVGLFVDPDDRVLEDALSQVRLDMIQLHGHESPYRIREIAQRFRRPVAKALSISTNADLSQVADYAPVCDWLLLDAKGSAEMPGGNGLAFDWTLLDGFQCDKPWMLAGGLNAQNVAEAIRMVRPPAVDVSSGVESGRGVKDPAKIRAFIEAVRSAD